MPADTTTFFNDADAIQAEAPAAITAPVKTKGMSRKRKLLLVGVAGFVAKFGVAAGVVWWLDSQHYVTTDNAYVGAATAQLNSQTSGQILSVHVDDTDFVKKGDILATIDPADAKLAADKAEADYRRTLQRVQQYFAQEAAALAQVNARTADFDRARLDYERRNELAATGAVSQEELSATRAAFEAASANLSAAQQNLQSARALTQGVSIDAHPETDIARAVWDTALLNLHRTTIVAPVDGVVTQRRAQVGQRIDPGQPLMSIAPIQSAWVDANFKEGQLGNVRVGQEVELTSDLYGHDVVFHGRVEGIGGGTGSAFAVIPAQNATGNWIKVVQRVPVRIALDEQELAAHPLRVGLSMEAKIDTRASEG